MPLDPRTPVIVGVGQSVRRPSTSDVPRLPEPADMMADVLRTAGDDSGAGAALLGRLDSLLVVSVLAWGYRNTALAVAERLGIRPADLAVSSVGGNTPQMLVNQACLAIQRGDAEAVAIVGCEAVYSRRLARTAGTRLPWSVQPDDTPPPRLVGDNRSGNSDAEGAASLLMPIQFYPLFENALRAAAGEGIDEHQRRVAAMWARFSEVAAANPYAWSRKARTPEEIATVGPDNRMVGFPYPKLMNANMQVDQAAGLILCSAEAARAAGVPPDRWVFPLSGADAHDHWFVTERDNLHSSPAIRLGGGAALRLAGTAPDDLAHVDLYSCFPAAVQIGAAEVGLPTDDPERPLTVTGGLGFAGGPGNNYVTHSIATMCDRLRADPGALGLVTALGWYLTKHAFGVYSTEPPSGGFKWESPQAEVDALPRRTVVTGEQGPASVETYTVLHERDGSPTVGIVVGRRPDGARMLGTVNDGATLAAMMTAEACGRPATFREGGAVDVDM